MFLAKYNIRICRSCFSKRNMAVMANLKAIATIVIGMLVAGSESQCQRPGNWNHFNISTRASQARVILYVKVSKKRSCCNFQAWLVFSALTSQRDFAITTHPYLRLHLSSVHLHARYDRAQDTTHLQWRIFMLSFLPREFAPPSKFDTIFSNIRTAQGPRGVRCCRNLVWLSNDLRSMRCNQLDSVCCRFTLIH